MINSPENYTTPSPCRWWQVGKSKLLLVALALCWHLRLVPAFWWDKGVEFELFESMDSSTNIKQSTRWDLGSWILRRISTPSITTYTCWAMPSGGKNQLLAWQNPPIYCSWIVATGMAIYNPFLPKVMQWQDRCSLIRRHPKKWRSPFVFSKVIHPGQGSIGIYNPFKTPSIFLPCLRSWYSFGPLAPHKIGCFRKLSGWLPVHSEYKKEICFCIVAPSSQASNEGTWNVTQNYIYIYYDICIARFVDSQSNIDLQIIGTNILHRNYRWCACTADLLNVPSVPKEFPSTQQHEQWFWLSQTQNPSVLPFSLRRWAPLQWDQRPGRVVVYSDDAWWCSGAFGHMLSLYGLHSRVRNLRKQDTLGWETKLNLEKITTWTWIFIISAHHLINFIAKYSAPPVQQFPVITWGKLHQTSEMVSRLQPLNGLIELLQQTPHFHTIQGAATIVLKCLVGSLRCATSLSMIYRKKWWQPPSIAVENSIVASLVP